MIKQFLEGEGKQGRDQGENTGHQRQYYYHCNTLPVGCSLEILLTTSIIHLGQNQSIPKKKRKHITRVRTKACKSMLAKSVLPQQKETTTLPQNNGYWSRSQNKLYFCFLQLYSSQFKMKVLRRSQRIFKYMSDYLGTRSPIQCRSHHQKMEKKCLTFENILHHLITTNQADTSELNTIPYFSSNPTSSKNESSLKLFSQNNQYFGQQSYFEMPKILQPVCWEFHSSSKDDFSPQTQSLLT